MMDETNWKQRQGQARAKEALETARIALNRAVNEIEAYQGKLELATTQQERAEIINWVINYLATSIYPNVRIDLLAAAQAELVSTTTNNC